ncbi:hypothetical protein HK103_002884 [Boothiomyces macroporosus]|uniref:Ran GTPase-activating protein (RanGAP) involved in mRNA processing and transport n=1 Tax=Boothiomyces macroporosus TaxID=261099 RepID=A0AAD5U958_9FUNG|nr:hypothetical protein HK103_002884 [Boothiomyces macroporosus]
MEEFLAVASKKYKKPQDLLLKFYVDGAELKKHSDMIISNGTSKSAMRFANSILKSNSQINYLKITGIDSEIVPHCVELLSSKSSIVQLDLGDIMDEGSTRFFNEMRWENFHPKLLKIYDCRISGDWLERLFKGLETNPHLDRLYIENCGLNDSHADAIVSLLERNQTIMALSLFDGHLSNSIQKIFKAVRNNKKLKRLRFDEQTLGKQGIAQFIDFFESDSRIEHFGFTCIRWDYETLKRFTKALRYKKSFNSIDLYGGTFTREGFAFLVNVIISNPFLSELDITSISVHGSQIFKDQIKKLLSSSSGLKNFTFNGCGLAYRQTVIDALRSNYTLTSFNSHPGYRKIDTLAKDPQITSLINRNIKYQANLAQELLYDARALLLLQLPFEIKEQILHYLCNAAMISNHQQKYLIYALLDRRSLGKLAVSVKGKISDNSLEDMMGRLTLSPFDQQKLIDQCIAYHHELNLD